MSTFAQRIEAAWPRRGWLACMLWPLSQVYRIVIAVRRLAYQSGLKRTELSPLPVIVVGNLSVGGTGKTPLCAHLVDYFRLMGWRPAIVSRGYGGHRFETAHQVTSADTAELVGDEPLMLFEQTGVPVCVCVKRADAVRELANTTNANIVFSDDGLQHLAMSRVAEVLVVDAARGFGNRWMLPAGPLRDRLRPLDEFDLLALQRISGQDLHPSLTKDGNDAGTFALENQWFSLIPSDARDLFTGECVELKAFSQLSVHALAGIGYPQRFFDALTVAGLSVIPTAFPDHHAFMADDLDFPDAAPVLVTAKDAVKLRGFVTRARHVYEVRTDIRISSALQSSIESLEQSMVAHKGATG